MENHPRYLEVVWGCHYAGADLHRGSSRLTSGELAYILNDCEAKVFITSQYKADQAAEIVADTPGVDAAPDARRRRSTGYELVRGRRRGAARRRRCDDRVAGTDMLYSSGTTGRPKGVDPAFDARAAATAGQPAVGGAAGDAVRRHRRHRCTCPRRRCTTPPRCASAWRRTRSAAPSW